MAELRQELRSLAPKIGPFTPHSPMSSGFSHLRCQAQCVHGFTGNHSHGPSQLSRWLIASIPSSVVSTAEEGKSIVLGRKMEKDAGYLIGCKLPGGSYKVDVPSTHLLKNKTTKSVQDYLADNLITCGNSYFINPYLALFEKRVENSTKLSIDIIKRNIKQYSQEIRIVQDSSFHDWLISLGIMSSRLTHVISHVRTSFLFKAE